MRPKVAHHTQGSSNIALLYMAYLASDDEKLGAFCNQSGLGQAELSSRLTDTAFQAFLLDHLLQDENELLAFAAENNLKPEAVMIARSKLPGFSYDT